MRLITATDLGQIDQPRFTRNPDFDPALNPLLGTITTKKKKRWPLVVPEGYGVKIVRATKLDPKKAHYQRTCFTPAMRREYRERWAQFFDVKVAELDGWRIHHRQPVCIDGSHRFRNLDLMPDAVHLPLHTYFIDPQTHLAAVGSTHNYLIPIPNRRYRIRGTAKRPKRERPEHLAALNADY